MNIEQSGLAGFVSWQNETEGASILMRRSYVAESLTQALLRLLEQKRLDEISVSELVMEAGVSRASFYRNFISVRAIANRFVADRFAELFSRNTMTAENVLPVVEQIFRGIYAYRREFAVLHRRGLLAGLDDLLYVWTVEQIERLGVLNNRYQPHYFAGASSALVKAWIGFGFEESPREMARIFAGSLEGYL